MTEYQRKGHQDRWLELLRAKFETKRAISKEELDDLYDGYGVRNHSTFQSQRRPQTPSLNC